MRGVITVIGKDKVGIIASVSKILADTNVNILDISQTIMKTIFTMVMLVDISESTMSITDLSDELSVLGKALSLDIRIQNEDIFNSMHRI